MKYIRFILLLTVVSGSCLLCSAQLSDTSGGFLSSSALQAGVDSPPTFTSVESGFTISLPAKPSEQRSEPTVIAGRNIETRLFVWITPQAEYLVMCMGMIKVVEDPKISKWIFDDARNNALKQENGKLLSERDLNLNGHVGREFIVEAPKGVFMDRVYLVKDRFYLISAFIPVAQPAEKAMASKILDSFKFIERTEAVVK